MSFAYFMPVKVVMGANCVFENRPLLAELGTKALIVTGKNSARTNGSLADAIRALEANGQSFCVFDRVMSNPTVDCVFEAAAAAKKGGCDFVVAIGGGSPMDAAKAAAALAVRDIPQSRVFAESYARALPIAAIPTTAGTGSEATPYAILTNDEAKTKTSIASAALFPRLALLDANYLSGLAKAVTINTALDALSHAVEGMLSVRASPLSDALAKESIRSISQCFEAIKAENPSLEVRWKLLRASTLAGMVIANTGTTAVHALGYQLTYWKNIDHGRANGLLLGEFLQFCAEKEKAAGQRRVEGIVQLMGLESPEAFSRIAEGLLGERETLAEPELEAYADRAISAKNIANCSITPDRADLAAMLKKSLGVCGVLP
jgi:alcohol dehydrogenase class IV